MTTTRFDNMPKVELHLHLEGALPPRTVLQLAQGNNLLDLLPATTEAEIARWFSFTDFYHFMDVVRTIKNLLRTPEDFALAVYAAGQELAAQNVRYAEITVTPYTYIGFLQQGVTIEMVLAGLEAGRQQVLKDFGVELRWIFDIPRQTGLNAFEYAQTRLFEPLGITVKRWPADPQHNSEGAAGLALTPREMAKFGYLYLNGGTWDSKVIVPEWFVRESTQKHSEGGNPEPADYGYLWWVMPHFQPFAYCAAGYGGQYIFVIPDHDLVMVTTGDHTLVPPPEMPIPLFFKYIVPTLQIRQ